MQQAEEPFPRDHQLKGEMQENDLRRRLHPQLQTQLDKQQQAEQLLKHRQPSRQLSGRHSHHLQETSKHPHISPDFSMEREDGDRQMTGRERISINKELIGKPSNFQHIGHINREVTSTQTTEEVKNLFQMVNLYQEQVGLLTGKAVEEEPVELREDVSQRVDVPLAGDGGLDGAEDDVGEVGQRKSPPFDHFEDAPEHVSTRFEGVELRKDRIRKPTDSNQARKAGYQFDQQRQTQTHQQTDQVTLLLDRVKFQDDFGEEERKNPRRSLPPRLLGSSGSLPREGKLRKDMIGPPKDFQHVMGAGNMLESHEKKSPLAPSHHQKEAHDGRGAKEPSQERVTHLRKDMIGPPTDFHHVMGAGQMHTAHETPPSHVPPNLVTSNTEGREEHKEIPYYRLPHPSAAPPLPPPGPPPSSARLKGGRLRKDMISSPTNFHHVMGTAPYHAAQEGPTQMVTDNEPQSSMEERVASLVKLGQDSTDLIKPGSSRKKSAIGHPTNFQHVVHIDTSTSESDLKLLLTEKTSDASVHGSAHDMSKGPACRGGAKQDGDGKDGFSATRPSAHTKLRKDMIGTPTNFQHVSHAGFDTGKA
ncbi:uncharacterized protein LOC122250585 isoform X2 [Penaeus japonicus]|uniref:uncharacterized protein LOC122250585 isoform X2 n=1 Tax=Penaeus japonicus TaxID=27405 RepID=UPI001C70B927|nr:uncharacterized protein LOC122250585 isoform X2 [Penaeus japonicus]